MEIHMLVSAVAAFFIGIYVAFFAVLAYFVGGLGLLLFIEHAPQSRQYDKGDHFWGFSMTMSTIMIFLGVFFAYCGVRLGGAFPLGLLGDTSGWGWVVKWVGLLEMLAIWALLAFHHFGPEGKSRQKAHSS